MSEGNVIPEAPEKKSGLEAPKQRPIAREKLAFVIANNKSTIDSCQRLLDHINLHPEIEGDLVKVFGIQPPPA